MINHAHFEIGKYVRLTLKDGSTEEGRIVDIYDVRGDEFVTLVRQGSLFHNPVAIDKVQAVEEIWKERENMYNQGGRIDKETKGTVAKGEIVIPLGAGKSEWIAEQIKKSGGE